MEKQNQAERKEKEKEGKTKHTHMGSELRALAGTISPRIRPAVQQFRFEQTLTAKQREPPAVVQVDIFGAVRLLAYADADCVPSLNHPVAGAVVVTFDH